MSAPQQPWQGQPPRPQPLQGQPPGPWRAPKRPEVPFAIAAAWTVAYTVGFAVLAVLALAALAAMVGGFIDEVSQGALTRDNPDLAADVALTVLPWVAAAIALSALFNVMLLWLIRRAEDVRRWHPAVQGVLAWAAAYVVGGALAGAAQLLAPLLGAGLGA